MPIFDVNEAAGTSTLKLYSGGAPLTQYSYAAGQVTVAERLDPAVLSCLDTDYQIAIIEDWIRQVSNWLNPSSTAIERFMAKVNRKANKTNGNYESNDVVLTDAEFVHATAVFTFGPRAQHVLPWSDYVRWTRFLRDFHRDCAGG